MDYIGGSMSPVRDFGLEGKRSGVCICVVDGRCGIRYVFNV